MLGQILQRLQMKKAEKGVRVALLALADGWDAVAFRQAAHLYLMPQEILPERLRRGQPARMLKQALAAFPDNEIWGIIGDVSPPHAEVVREYPEWATAFLRELRRMYAGSSTS